ncbi:MAG: mechanosensitive ion channel protein MscS [Cenarchaeum symbiont of Oopsacas minuta]|nr:mechanosensitive ion channel protein MscS [Cenarchaeum symbiont of Oopsacas minuta]
MVEDELVETVSTQVEGFETVGNLLASSTELQVAFIVLIVGIISIIVGYRAFSTWIRGQKFRYFRPHTSRFIRVAVLPLFAIALVTSTNAYVHTVDLFGSMTADDAERTFPMILDTLNILVIGYTISHIIPIILTKREMSILEKNDYDVWISAGGFIDDQKDLFHTIFRWIPPKNPPEEITEKEFAKYLSSDKGRKYLEAYHTSKGIKIGTYEEIVKHPYEAWKKQERAKYAAYYESCVSGNNEVGKKLKLGQNIEEVYPIDTWREMRRLYGYEIIVAGSKPSGNAKKRKKDIPKSATQMIPVGIFATICLWVVSWWGVDLWVLATATGGLAVGVGFALQETMQNWFAYIMIRKDNIISEGDRVSLESGYNGYVHKITSRVTYIRDGLNESFAIIPTRQLVSGQITSYSKEVLMVPAVVKVGVSYLNDPKQVSAVLTKVGKRAMLEIIDSNNRHMIRQRRCPYLDNNMPSCGCDKNIHVELEQPLIRFNEFNDSALDFTILLYVWNYGSQFKVKTDVRMIMYEEFKKYDIRIPWPIRTVYQGDEKREAEEIGRHEAKRNQLIDEFGIGSSGTGGTED